MKTIAQWIAAAALTLPLAADPVKKTDPFTEILREAVKEYQAGKLDKAKASLDKAAAIIDSEQAGKVADSFPEAPKNWTGGEVEREAIPDLLGGGRTVRKSYLEKGSRKEIVLEVITGSKFTALVAGMGSNDAIAQSQGYEVKSVGKDRALLKGSELLLPVDSNILIKLTAKGGADDKDLLTLARDVDRHLLKRMQ